MPDGWMEEGQDELRVRKKSMRRRNGGGNCLTDLLDRRRERSMHAGESEKRRVRG